MKSCPIKRTTLLIVFLALITVVSCFCLSACGLGSTSKLTSESGVVVEGGDFEKDCTLDASLIDSESEGYSQVISAIEEQSYDKTKPVYVFEVSVFKDGVKVQPNGKVKVTIPVSGDLTGYDVLHIKDDGSIERLSITYKNGKATFETDSFSKFVFVKKILPAGDESGSGEGGTGSGGSGDEAATTKYTFCPVAKRIVSPTYSQEGGYINDSNGEYITNSRISLAAGTKYTVEALCSTTDFYFVGWYEATEREEATEETFISSEPIYTFTINKNLNVCALFAYKTDAVKLKLIADKHGFTYRNGEPVVTLVAKDSTTVPAPQNVEVMGTLGNGGAKNYGYQAGGSTTFSDNIIVDEGGLDYSKVGTYTITYSYKHNTNINASLKVQVVGSGHTLNVSTNDNNLVFYYDNVYSGQSLVATLPVGRPVTLTAETGNGYAFTGWYDENEELVSKKFVYCFEMPGCDVALHGKYEASSITLAYSVGYYSEGELVDDFGNAYIWDYRTIYVKAGETISLTARETEYYEFMGWYDLTGDTSTFMTLEKKIEVTLNESKSVKAYFREKVKYIEIDPDTLLNAGFVNGQVGFAIGDTALDYSNFTVKEKGVAGSYGTLSAEHYTIDDSTVDFNTVGIYTITYTYKYNTSIKTEIKIIVVNPENAQFTFNRVYSYLDHEFNGKATFISLRDVKFNDVPLYEFGTNSKIWDKISYKWIDKTTNMQVDTTGVDITINGTVVKEFGPSKMSFKVGNEFGGPIKAGSYRFELSYNGETVLTQDSTISTQVYKKITTSEDFKTNEGSTWVNFELYYNTIIGYADGKYFVMQMPSIGADNYEAEAREVTVDANGNAVIGAGNDFAFVNMRYLTTDNSGYTEFLTGYYGSYVERSSNTTADGTMFGSPYIYRTGYTRISDGKICREYGDKIGYGMSTTFGVNGAVTIHSRYSENTNGKLRLVKDGDRYVFTSASANTDTRQSYDVFIYRTIIENETQDSSK